MENNIFYICEGNILILLDLSGLPLHKRGYRTDGGFAPLRETTAAVMLQMMMWRRKIPLHDPFCGSGTFTRPLIEKGIPTMGYDNVPQAIARLGENGVVRDLFRLPLWPEELFVVDFIVFVFYFCKREFHYSAVSVFSSVAIVFSKMPAIFSTICPRTAFAACSMQTAKPRAFELPWPFTTAFFKPKNIAPPTAS